MAKQKTEQNNGAAVNPAVASAADNLEAARKKLREAQNVFATTNAEYLDVVERTRTPIQLLDELEKIMPLSEAQFEIIRRYESKELGARLAAIGVFLAELRRAIERTTA